MNEKIEKSKFVAKALANGYLIADQKLSLLLPLIEDQELYQSWNGTPGASAVDAMRMTLYTTILSDVRTLLFDKDKRAVSAQQIVSALENEHVAKAFRKEYAQASLAEMLGDYADDQSKEAIAQHIQEHEIQQLEKTFDEKSPQLIKKFYELKSSDLGKRVDSARSKMISHKEINTSQGERALYNPADFGLKWSDAKNILSESKDVIFECNLIINNSHYDLDSFSHGSKEAGDSFWSRVKNV